MSTKNKKASWLKTMAAACAVSLAALGAQGAETITIDRTVNHYPWDGKVDCVTTVSGLESGETYYGVFTLSVEQGGETETITNENLKADGTYTNTFDCAALFGEGLYPNGGITVALVKKDPEGPKDATGKKINIKGEVLVIDISGGSSATTYPTKEYKNVDIGTFNCDVYKTTKIVLRKVPAGSYLCKPGSDAELATTDTLATKGFYIGVFAVTATQYANVMGGTAGKTPVVSVSWTTLRGSVAAGTAITKDSADSFLQRLVARTGLSGIDLPTQAQWEIACRAGSVHQYGSYWDGAKEVQLTTGNFGAAAWYDNAVSTAQEVGQKAPNLWGLYDTQGNVWEWCRDNWSSTFSQTDADTPCTVSSQDRVVRGGDWSRGTTFCRPSYRDCCYTDAVMDFFGFRVLKALP